MVKIYILLFIAAFQVCGQDSEIKSFGTFRNAGAFFITPAGFIYVADLAENRIYKLDTLGKVLKDIGGYGWEESAFDEPYDIFASPLNIFVTDRNNHRIQWFDKDLNFISMLQTRDQRENNIQFGYPAGAALTQQGDLVVLDSENNRLLMFDMFGTFKMEFGGNDAGKFRIKKPVKMTILQNNTYVLDEKGKRVVVFDQFGTGLSIIPLSEKMNNISSSDGRVLINNTKKVMQVYLETGELKKLDLPAENIADIFMFDRHLYILTPSRILVYPGL